MLQNELIVINNIVNNMYLSLDKKIINKREIAVYEDGKFQTVFDNEILYNELDLKKYVTINHDLLLDNPFLNAGIFIRQMIYRTFYDNKDPRIPNNLMALNYPESYLNYDYLRYERELLFKSYNSNDKFIKLNFFRMFLNVRSLRKEIVGEEFSLLEYKLETIEGLSQYKTCKLLFELDRKKFTQHLKTVLDIAGLSARDYFSFHNQNIYSGLVMLLIMDDLGLEVDKLFKSKLTIYEFALKHVKFIHENIAIKSDKNLIGRIEKYDKEITEKFSLFFATDPIKHQGQWQIYQFDPNRIYNDKGNILHESFVVLKSLLDNSLLRIEGPVVTKIMDNSFDIVTSYYQMREGEN